MSHLNAPRLSKVISLSMAEVGNILPLQSPQISYAGQVVAVIIADDLQSARDGVRALRFQIEPTRKPVVDLENSIEKLRAVKRAGIGPGVSKKGKADHATKDAPVIVEAFFRHAPHHQNPIEPGTVIASWDPDGGVTIDAAVQWHHIDALMIGQAFKLGSADQLPGFLWRIFGKSSHTSKVRLRNHFSGGAFGRNISYQALLLAPMAAKVVCQPVRFVQTRRDTFSLMSHRAQVRQSLRMATDDQGGLLSVILEPEIAQGHADFIEPIGEVPMQVYKHETHRLTTKVASMDLPGSGWMRGPGVSHAMFALEQGMDRLARRLGMDPLELRIQNHADVHPVSGKGWESKRLLEAYQAGADAIGWRHRPLGGNRRPDGRLIGYGMATAIDLGRQFPATAKVVLDVGPKVHLSIAVAEMGQGLLTGLTGLAAEMFGLSPASIHLDHKRTDTAYAAGSIGSTGTYSNAAAILDAAQSLVARLAQKAARDQHSPLKGHNPKGARLADGYLIFTSGQKEPLQALIERYGSQSATGRAGLTFGSSKHAKASFGAVFCEVAVDPLTYDLQVTRLVGAYDCGRVLQPSIAEAQLRGAMIMGLGQALMEETRLDPNTGAWTNADLGEAFIPTQADVPPIDVIMLEHEKTSHHLDFKGIAETGIVGVAPAIASAFADATGGWISSVPMGHDERVRAVVGSQMERSFGV
jgi:xanthine dehydrogenase YagR molybdenum-binding subunit